MFETIPAKLERLERGAERSLRLSRQVTCAELAAKLRQVAADYSAEAEALRQRVAARPAERPDERSLNG
jgi:hypothetical protein